MLKLLFVVPAPAKYILAVFKPVGFEVVQVDPLYSSVAPVVGASITTKS
jgi:hypothetical protein